MIRTLVASPSVPSWIRFEQASELIEINLQANVCDLGVVCTPNAITLNLRAVARDQWNGRTSTDFILNFKR